MVWKSLKRRSVWVPLCVIYVCAILYVWSRPKRSNLQAIASSDIESEGDVQIDVLFGRQHPTTERAIIRAGAVEKESKENGKLKVEATEGLNSSKICDLCIVMGIPSIKRPGGAVYLDQTLEFVVRKRKKFDNVIFVVYLAETDEEWRKEMTELVKTKFGSEVDRGLIQIIHPPEGLYPDWNKEMKITLGDPRHQVQWRSKQNIDQAYLMAYAYGLKPKYYLGIEDDISAVDNYLSTIFEHAESVFRDSDDILFISYCKWGAIGKLFHVKMLPTVSNYLKILWNYKPLDWLYWDLKRTLACRYPLTNCDKEANSIVVDYKDQLFDHTGKVSSLDKSIKS